MSSFFNYLQYVLLSGGFTVTISNTLFFSIPTCTQRDSMFYWVVGYILDA